ncbi:hypothetical protein cje100_06992 [Campylobacter jejuni subsp. jejuni LMG 23216]|nr:hypothetical protein cje100_06992 [Campylobacter jejuni subsp. jejuni LMG 23216]
MINLYGKSGNNFYLVAKDDIKSIWQFDIVEYEEIDFIQNGSQYNLEDNEIFFIKTKNEDVKLYLSNIENTSNCNSITRDAIKTLETLYFFTKDNLNNIELFIQRIMPSTRIEKNFLKMDINIAHIEKNQITIPILNYTHIYWSQKNQKIYFKKFSDLENVFSNFAHYFREANEEDIKKFTDSGKYPFLDIGNLNFKETSKIKLKALALIVDELENVKENLHSYEEYAKKYKPNFVKNGKFRIETFNNINDLSDVVFRKIYTTEAGEQEVRKANSFKVIKSNV